MKGNVDLTQNRKFTTPEEPTGLFAEILDLIKITKPWDFENNPIKSVVDLELQWVSERKVFTVGNKEERRIWKRNTRKTGYFCGQNTDEKPWTKYFMNYSPRIPWKF